MKRFTLSKKMVAQVRYYETMYLITDKAGTRVFTGNDEDTAKKVLAALNGYEALKDFSGRKNGKTRKSKTVRPGSRPRIVRKRKRR